MRNLIFILVFLPFLSYGSVKTEGSFLLKGTKTPSSVKIPSYAVVFKNSVASCVVSTRHKPHLLPSFYPKQTDYGEFYDESYLSASLNLPLCSLGQENEIVAQSKRSVMEGQIEPEQVAAVTWGALLAWGAVSQVVSCGSSFFGAKLIGEESYLSGSALLGLSFLLPGIKLFFVCGGVGSFVGFYESEEDIGEKIEKEINKVFQPQHNDHPYLKSVVSVYVRDKEKEEEENKSVLSKIFDLGNAKGSGFFVAKNMVITNYHVIEFYDEKPEEKKVVIKRSDGLDIPMAELVAVDKERDLALLRIEEGEGVPVAIGDSDKLAILDTVIVVGNPLILRNSLSKGHVSQIQKQGDIIDIQYTSPTSPGNSGGALFLESTGELVGIPYKSARVGQSINFAIPSNDLKKFLKENNVDLDEEADSVEEEPLSRKAP